MMLSLEEQLKAIMAWPAREELSKPDQGSSVPYLSGDMVKFKLNKIFGPAGWGYETISWPRLVEVGDAAFYLGEYEVWFRFADGTVVKRQVSGLVPLRGGSEGAKTNIVRMGIGGCVTDAIKEAAATLGPAFGLGLNDETVKAVIAAAKGRSASAPVAPAPAAPAPAATPAVPAAPAHAPAPVPTAPAPAPAPAPFLPPDTERPPFLADLAARHDKIIAANPAAGQPVDEKRFGGLKVAMARKLEASTVGADADSVWAYLERMLGPLDDAAWLSVLSTWISGRDFLDDVVVVVGEREEVVGREGIP